MYILIDELKECIYNEEVYKQFMSSKMKLEDEDVRDLLLRYQDIKEQYFSMKKYEKYIDTTSIKEEYLKIKRKVSENKNIQEYYNDYYLLNDMLDDLTKIIFKDISDELSFDRYLL